MLIVLSLLSLSFELLASFWCPCTILPHFVIESGPKMFVETEKFQLFTRFEFPSYVSIKSKLQYPPAGQTPGHLSFWTSVYANPLLLLEAKLFKCSTHPTFSWKAKSATVITYLAWSHSSTKQLANYHWQAVSWRYVLFVLIVKNESI